jgi:MerR family transcriptional regulator, light-induced transcriptional regulator
MSSRQSTAPAGQGLTWSAGAVARMLGLPASTLRSWHRRYNIPVGDTPSGRHRRYTTADINALLRMKHLISQGASAQSAAQATFSAIRTADMGGLLAAVSRLDTDTATAMLEAHITAHGVVDTWETLCCPALNILGGPEAADVDHCIDLVHTLSWTITTALHRIPTPPSTGPVVLLACVDGEHHTLPLEALRAALAHEGIPARLLGASIPPVALKDALARTDPPPAALVLWAHRPAELGILSTPHTRVFPVGPGWPTAHARSLPDAISRLV